jgi:hypothetical protein
MRRRDLLAAVAMGSRGTRPGCPQAAGLIRAPSPMVLPRGLGGPQAGYEGQGVAYGLSPASLPVNRRVLLGWFVCGAAQRTASLAPEFFDGSTTTSDRSGI